MPFFSADPIEALCDYTGLDYSLAEYRAALVRVVDELSDHHVSHEGWELVEFVRLRSVAAEPADLLLEERQLLKQVRAWECE